MNPYRPTIKANAYQSDALVARLRELLALRKRLPTPRPRRWMEMQAILAVLQERGDAPALCYRVSRMRPERRPAKRITPA